MSIGVYKWYAKGFPGCQLAVVADLYTSLSVTRWCDYDRGSLNESYQGAYPVSDHAGLDRTRTLRRYILVIGIE